MDVLRRLVTVFGTAGGSHYFSIGITLNVGYQRHRDARANYVDSSIEHSAGAGASGSSAAAGGHQ
jgi:hypothetical protein